jgi:hypothetical protein
MEATVVRHLRHFGFAYLVTAALMCAMALPARAEYTSAGYNLQVVQSELGLANAAVNYQTNGLWTVSGLGTEVGTSFSLPSAQNIRFARLYLDVWGGTAAKTATVTASVNGTALAPVNFGGTKDTNPTYNASQTSVYGSGAGAWQVAFSGISGLLKKGRTANTLSFTITDPLASGFDGRTYGASLISVYSDPSIHQTLDYFLAEGDGTMRSAANNTYLSPDVRSLTFSGLNVADVNSATYQAGYTHGNTRSGTTNLDKLDFNGNPLGADPKDVSTGNTTSYPPNNLSFDVTGYLANESTVRYSVNNLELGGTGDTYLRANIGLLAVSHPVPEPSTFVLLASGAVGFLRYFARRRNR